MSEGRLARLAPWSGLVGGALAWALQYQFLVDLLHFGCPPAQRSIGIASGAAAAALAAASGLASWRAERTMRGGEAAQTRRFVAFLSVLAAAFALAAIALQTAATLILPPCVS
jgi:hypothetical protein